MKRNALLAGIVLVGIFSVVRPASAVYHPTLRRFIQRDPGSGATAVSRAGRTTAGRRQACCRRNEGRLLG